MTSSEVSSFIKLIQKNQGINSDVRTQLLLLMDRYISEFKHELDLTNLLILLDDPLIS